MRPTATVLLGAAGALALAAAAAAAPPAGIPASPAVPATPATPGVAPATPATPAIPAAPAAKAGVAADADVTATGDVSKRQGPANASATGVANANEHAALSSTTATDLTGLKTGLTVKSSAGATLGTVSKIMKSKDGTIENVLVTGADGKTYRVAPGTLSLSGDVVIVAAASKD